MKKCSKYLTTVLVLLTCMVNAQKGVLSATPLPSLSTVSSLPSLDIFGAIPIKDCGGGAGFNILSKPLNIGNINYNSPLQVRFGGEFYFTTLHHQSLGTVPLSDPQEGNARVKLHDDMYGLNAMARFSMPYSKRITPYLDVFAGLRAFSAGMNITPEVHIPGNEVSTSQNLSSIGQFNYGATLGFLVSLGEYVKFNTGLMLTRSDAKNEFTNIKKTYVDVTGNIVTEKMQTLRDVFVLKVGFTFLLRRSNNCNSYNRNGMYRSRTTYGSYYGGGIGGGRSNRVNISTRPSR